MCYNVIYEHYISTNVGDILIPGFKIGYGEFLNKEVWIDGYYYSPTSLLEVDGKLINNNLVYLEQGEHIFFNPTKRPIFVVYIFKPDIFPRHQES